MIYSFSSKHVTPLLKENKDHNFQTWEQCNHTQAVIRNATALRDWYADPHKSQHRNNNERKKKSYSVASWIYQIRFCDKKPHFFNTLLKTAYDKPACWQKPTKQHLEVHLLATSDLAPHELHQVFPGHCCQQQKSSLVCSGSNVSTKAWFCPGHPHPILWSWCFCIPLFQH